jgi:hypothetical protein
MKSQRRGRGREGIHSIQVQLLLDEVHEEREDMPDVPVLQQSSRRRRTSRPPGSLSARRTTRARL